jgi:hypothetical protein
MQGKSSVLSVSTYLISKSELEKLYWSLGVGGWGRGDTMEEIQSDLLCNKSHQSLPGKGSGLFLTCPALSLLPVLYCHVLLFLSCIVLSFSSCTLLYCSLMCCHGLWSVSWVCCIVLNCDILNRIALNSTVCMSCNVLFSPHSMYTEWWPCPRVDILLNKYFSAG